MPVNHQDIIAAVHNGDLDEHLDSLLRHIASRNKTLTDRTLATVKPGDEVTFSDQIRLKYLIGLTANVVKRNRKSVVVSCPDDPAYGRFQNSQNVRCPNDLIAGLAS